MKKLLIVLVLLVVCVSLFLGCTKTTPSTTTTTTTAAAVTPKTGGTLRVISGAASPTNNGGWPASVVSSPMEAGLCLEGLLRSDNDGKVIPWLAENYKIADDHKSATFYLRKDVKFQDGTPFNAQAAKWNLDNQITAKLVPYWASVDIIDDYTVRINFTKWVNTMLISLDGICDSPRTWMVSPTAFQQHDKDWMTINPVGTGPFKFASFQRDVSYKVVKNPDYWQKGKPYLDAIEVLYVAEDLTKAAMMQNKEADVRFMGIDKSLFDMAAIGLSLNNMLSNTYTLFPDTAHPDSPFAKKEVREAVEYAINREAIAKAFSFGYWKAVNQIPASTSPVYDPNFKLARSYDPEKAKQLLTQAGYPTGFEATLYVSPMRVSKDIVTAIQADLSKVNITLKLDFLDMGRFLELANAGTAKNAMFIEPFTSQNPNEGFVRSVSPESTFNKFWERTPAWIELYNASTTSLAPDVKLMRNCTDYLTKEALLIPVYPAGSGVVFQSYVKNGGFLVRGGSLSSFIAENAWLDK